MRSFKRALLATLAFLLCVVLLSALVCLPLMTGRSGYNDSAQRDALAGTLDLLISGASHGTNAFVPPVIDEILGSSSYNLSGFRISMAGRRALLEKELARNDVKTVVLEISYDSFSRDPDAERGKGEAMTIARLDGVQTKLRYMREHLSLGDGGYDNVYSLLLGYGVHGWINLLRGSSDGVAENRGWWDSKASDVSLRPEEAAALHQTEQLRLDWYPEQQQAFRDLVSLCRAHGAQVIVCVAPLSDSVLWRTRGWDTFLTQLSALCEENACTLLDFNLRKDRSEWLRDRDCFQDDMHMSGIGAHAFSRVFAETLAALGDGDVSQDFYDSYAQLLTHSPYASGTR